MTDEVRDGGINLLGKVDAWDNLIRIKSESVAQELMGMILKEFCDNDLTSSGALHQKLHRLLIEQGVPFHGSKFMVSDE